MRKKQFALLIGILAVTLLLTACAGVNLTLTFEVDGEAYATVTTTGQEAVQMPKDPTKEGYVFDGWYWDKDVWEKPFTVNSLLETPLTESMTVYAKWKEKAEEHVHSYGEWTVATAATCTAEGMEKRVCECGEEETRAIAKLAHTYVVKHDATNHWKECSVCHEVTDNAAHRYEEWTVVTAATCTAEGLEKSVCECGLEETRVIEKLPHSFGEWTVKTAATCTAEGLEKRVCECGEEETRVTEKLPHSFGEWTVTTAATCTTEGTEKRVCECGEEETRTTEMIPHSYGEWTVVTAATCTAEGLEKSICSVCETEETRSIAKLPHTYGEWTVVTVATCTAEGTEKHVCSVCETAETRVIEKLPHTYEVKHDTEYHWKECTVCHEVTDNVAHRYEEWTVVTAATCTAEGLEKRVCSVCGEEETCITEKLPHSYGEWTVVTAATCTAEGLEKRVCSVCETEETKTIAIKAHDYITKYDQENHWSECSVCNNKKDEAAHTYENDVCTVCGSEYVTIGLEYKEVSGGYEVAGIGTVKESRIVIPSMHKGEPVIGIGELAFSFCSSLVSVVIPEGVTSIGSSAFYNCSNLVSIVIPNSVTSINDGVFYECSSLVSIEIPSSVTSIGASAFYKCSSLVSIVIPNSVTSINDGVFYECSSLVSIEIPSSVTSIGFSAFQYCSRLTDIAIPLSVTSIAIGAFAGCYNLEILTVEVGNPNYLSVGNCIIETKTETLIAGCKKSIIPTDGSVTTIGYAAFFGSGLVSVVIPEGVTRIGSYAFYNCSSLVSVKIPSSVTSIGSNAFSFCSSLVSVEIPSSVTSIGSYAFYNCSSLTKVEISDIAAWCGIEFGDYYANPLYYAKHLYINGEEVTELVIPEGVTSIGNYAFSDCSSLVSVVIPSSVTSIGYKAFSGCSSLESITIPFVGETKDGISNTHFGYIFGANSYSDHSTYVPKTLKTVIITGGTSIGSYAFYKCSGLVSIEIPSSVTSIGDHAFCYCNSIVSIIIPFGVTSIGDKAFIGCRSLVNIVIPSSVTSIGDQAFNGCSSLVNIVIPSSVTSIGYNAFYGCYSLTICTEASVQPSGWDSSWNSDCPVVWDYKNNDIADDGVIYTVQNGIRYGIKDGAATVARQPSNIKTANIPSEIVYKDNAYRVTSIGSAFFGCSNLAYIEIPSSVTSIGSEAFRFCSGLVSVEIPSSVTSIGSYAFEGCSSLVSVAIPEGVTSIGFAAFRNCSSLVSVEIPSSVTSIDIYVFSECSNLETITVEEGNTKYHSAGSCLIETETKTLIAGCKNSIIPTDGSVTSIGNYAFRDCRSLVSIEIPNSVTSIGYNAFEGCSSLESVEIPSSVTSIGNHAFSETGIWNNTAENSVVYADKWAVGYKGEKSTVTNIVLPADTVGIGDSAFEGCSSLESIEIPSSVTSIGYRAFFNCYRLVSIAISDSVTIIGDDAFWGCSSLESIEYGGTKAEWKAITKGIYWNDSTGNYTVTCTDGTLSKSES